MQALASHLQCARKVCGRRADSPAARALGESRCAGLSLVFPRPLHGQVFFCGGRMEGPLLFSQGRAVCCSCSRCSRASWPAIVLWEPRAPAAWNSGLMLSPGMVPSLLLTPPVQVTTTDAGNICPELIHSIAATRGTAASSVCFQLPGFPISTSPKEKSDCFPSLAAHPLNWAFWSLFGAHCQRYLTPGDTPARTPNRIKGPRRSPESLFSAFYPQFMCQLCWN